MSYQPIENYRLIGNLHTAALFGMDGSIDWLCVPRFDSPSVFAAVLDDQKGSRFRIAPTGENIKQKQHYWPNTNSFGVCGSYMAACRFGWSADPRSTMPEPATRRSSIRSMPDLTGRA
jgi:hypothetical protein